jgi:hypothetical protein
MCSTWIHVMLPVLKIMKTKNKAQHLFDYLIRLLISCYYETSLQRDE